MLPFCTNLDGLPIVPNHFPIDKCTNKAINLEDLATKNQYFDAAREKNTTTHGRKRFN